LFKTFSFFFQSDFTDLHFQHDLLIIIVARSATSIIWKND